MTSSTEFGTTSNLPVDIEIPGYRLRRQIGSDPLGLWFDAEQESLGRKVTVRVLRPEHWGSDAHRREFLAETDLLSSINHPNLTRVLDTQRDPLPAVEVDRIDKRTLARLLEPGKPIGEDSALHYAHCIAQALHYLQDRGLAIRDIGPRHVNLREDGGCRIVTLSNVITLGEQAKLKGKLFQDARYVAPEQVGGEGAVGPTTPCYQLVALLFHMLAGRAPHRIGTPAEIARAHLTEDFPSLKTAQPFLRKGIHGLVSACTAPEPEDRPSLKAVVEALEVLKVGRDPGIRPKPKLRSKGGIAAPRPRRRRRRR